MWITFRDVQHQEIWCDQADIGAFILPSALSGHGKCQVFVKPSLMCEVTRETADRLLSSLTDLKKPREAAVDLRYDINTDRVVPIARS